MQQMIDRIYDHACTRCPLSAEVPPNETICVGGRGAYPAKGMILGEAPGQEESLVGAPFLGRAGRLLDEVLQASGIKDPRSSPLIFVTNTVKCRPQGNRAPEPYEEHECRVFLLREFQVVQPTHVLALGNHALRASTGLWGITKYVGIWHQVPRKEKDDLMVLPCYHPAYVLRQPSLRSAFQSIVQDFVDHITQ